MGTLFVIESHFKVTFKEIKCLFAGISQSLKNKISYQKYAAMIKKNNSKTAQFGNLMDFLEKYLRLFDLCCYFYYNHHILFLFFPLKTKKTLTTNIEGYMYMYLCVNEVCMCINF